jgi:hypothetical protein
MASQVPGGYQFQNPCASGLYGLKMSAVETGKTPIENKGAKRKNL